MSLVLAFPITGAHQRGLELITRTLDSLGITVQRQDFPVKDPYSSDTLRLTNIIARLNPDQRNRLLFCAHWDSRPRSEMDTDSAKRSQPLPGANDGASGVAVLLELATELKATSLERGVDLLFLDGEDWGKSGDLDYYCLGAKEFARHVDAKIYDYGLSAGYGWRQGSTILSRKSTRCATNRSWLTECGRRAARLGMATDV